MEESITPARSKWMWAIENFSRFRRGPPGGARALLNCEREGSFPELSEAVVSAGLAAREKELIVCTEQVGAALIVHEKPPESLTAEERG